MKKLMNLFFALAVVTFVYFFAPAANAAGNTVTVELEVQFGQSEARRMLDMLNDFRTNGDDELCRPWYWNSSNQKVYPQPKELTYDYSLEAIAMQRAVEIAVSFSHTRPDNSNWYTTPGFRQYPSRAENIAMGSSSADATFLNLAEHDYPYSYQGHRRNMLSSYSAVGIAHVFYNGIHYWVQEFANPVRDTNPTPANDSSAIVSIDITDGRFDVRCIETSITMDAGSSRDLPELYTTVITSNTYPGYPCPVLGGEWSVEDTSIAAIVDGKLVAKTSGETRLIGTSYGKTVEVSLNVSASVKIEAELSHTCISYTGSEIHPDLTVSDESGKVLAENQDYTVQYVGDCIEPGEYSVVVSGIGSYSFQSELKFEVVRAMKLPGILSTIESEAFSGLGVPMIVVPSGVDVIEPSAFAYCSNLKVLVFESNPSEIADSILSGCGNVTIQVTRGGTAEQWAQNNGYPIEYV